MIFCFRRLFMQAVFSLLEGFLQGRGCRLRMFCVVRHLGGCIHLPHVPDCSQNTRPPKGCCIVLAVRRSYNAHGDWPAGTARLAVQPRAPRRRCAGAAAKGGRGLRACTKPGCGGRKPESSRLHVLARSSSPTPSPAPVSRTQHRPADIAQTAQFRAFAVLGRILCGRSTKVCFRTKFCKNGVRVFGSK